MLEAGATTDLDIVLSLEGGKTEAIAGEVLLSVRADGGCEQQLSFPIVTRLNVDDVPKISATDSFDPTESTWTAWSAAWQHVRVTPLDGKWHGADLSIASDARLTTPYLDASPTEPLRVSFNHAYSFEYSSATAFDGGVIEYSIGNDDVWEDISTLASPSYSGTLGDNASNPLHGRMAYVGQSSLYPDTETVTMDLGTALAGKTFRLRFRIGTDSGTGDEGWTIDNVGFSGIVGTPFTAQMTDDGKCSGAGQNPDDPLLSGGGGGCCDAGSAGGSGGCSGCCVSFGVLALVLRRRRSLLGASR
jgi:hypothetical protein